MEQETYEVENRWRNKYMNLGRELGEIINSQQDRILSLAQENTKLKRELWHLKKVKGQEMALKSLVTVLKKYSAQSHQRNGKTANNPQNLRIRGIKKGYDMENQLQTTKGAYLTDLQQLDGETLRNFVDPKHQASPQELQTLLAIVKNRNLNPFTKEVYFIKYGNNPAQIVVSKDAFMKRAEQNQNYDGFESGVIYENEQGELKTKKGVILPRKATLIGGWCEVYRKDRSRPVYREVELSAYNTHKNWWQKAPGQMIEKVAIVAAVRDAFSENVGGLYTADEMEQAAPIDVTPRETQEDVKARKMAQIEQQRQEQAQPVQPEQELVEDAEEVEEQPQPQQARYESRSDQQPNFISNEQHDTIMQQINELALITGQATETVANYYLKKYKLNDFHELLVAGFNVVSNDIQTQINNRKG